MDYLAKESKLSQLSARFNLMVTLVLALLLSNIILALVIIKIAGNERLEIVPFNGASSYLKSPKLVDIHYLNLMAENFIYARLNVTPEIITVNHTRLVNFINPASYAALKKILNAEAKVIKEQKISSFFNIQEIHSDVSSLTTEVTGILKRYVGNRELSEALRTYTLRYQYAGGYLSILSFNHKENSNV